MTTWALILFGGAIAAIAIQLALLRRMRDGARERREFLARITKTRDETLRALVQLQVAVRAIGGSVELQDDSGIPKFTIRMPPGMPPLDENETRPTIH